MYLLKTNCSEGCVAELPLAMPFWDTASIFFVITAKTRYWFIWQCSRSMSESRQWKMNYIRKVMHVNIGNKQPGETSGLRSYIGNNQHSNTHKEANHRRMHFDGLPHWLVPRSNGNSFKVTISTPTNKISLGTRCEIAFRSYHLWPRWWGIDIGPCNGLVPLVSKPLSKLDSCYHIASLGNNEWNICRL